MIKLMDLSEIIRLKNKGLSNRNVAKQLGINRKTVNKYWNKHTLNVSKLDTDLDTAYILNIQENIIDKPKYNSESRIRKKITPELLNQLQMILDSENRKDKVLGPNKQALTKKQIHKQLQDFGFDISYPSIVACINKMNNSNKECFIKQEYDFGDRFEYDFGEVKLLINGVAKKYYIAVISSPASNFRWCYLYNNSKKDVFLDSHVKFFKMIGGVPNEFVYDNMRNVISKFIGRNEKELNEDLVKMSIYYGFNINVTNAFSGNEKGHVEGSVKFLRNQIFATNYSFNSEELAIEYMNSMLLKINEVSSIEEEKLHLKAARPPLEIAEVRQSTVNKYSFINIQKNMYSVPEYLVGSTVTSKIYYDKILIYSNYEFVCEHKKIDGEKNIKADIRHYLKTLSKKPGSLKNSNILKTNKIFNSIYHKYYTNNPKDFIEIFNKNKEKSDLELEQILIQSSTKLVNITEIQHTINSKTRLQTSMYNNIKIGVS